MISRPLIIPLLLSLTLAHAGSALTAESAEQLVTKALELRRKGQHEQALPLFQRANEIEPSPMTLAQLGLAEQAVRRWTESERHLSEALATKAPWIEKNRVHLQRALSTVENHIGELVIDGTPSGAQVYVNSTLRGSLPLKAPIRVGEGDASIQITAPKHQPHVQTVAVKGKSSVKLEVALEQVAVKETPAAANLDARRPAEADRGDQPSWWTARRIGGVALVGAGAGAIVGGVALLRLNGRAACDAKPGDICQDRWTTSTPGWAFVGAGGAGVVAGAVMLLWHKPVQVTASPTAFVVSYRGSL
jgi:hypothetical protein